MSTPDAEAAGRRLFVGIGNTTSGSGDRDLPRAVSDVHRLAVRLEELGLDTEQITDPADAGEARKQLAAALPTNHLADARGVLVLLWAGHATVNANTGDLMLLTADDGHATPFAVQASEVTDLAALSQAKQILLLFDTCYSGQATVDAVRIMGAAAAQHAEQRGRWAGVLASSQAHERAVDGALVSRLLDLLEHGPDDPALMLRWSTYQGNLRGDDLIDALIKGWDEEGWQSPVFRQSGDAYPIMRNPLYRPGAQDHVVEHLLWAARGAAQPEQGNWFTGRERQLEQLVAWIRRGIAGICVVTGPAGSGKSAVVGRVVSLSDGDERATIVAAGAAPDAALDPGAGAVDAHVQVRGMGLTACATALAQALGLPPTGVEIGHHDVLAWAQKRDATVVVAIDGLDEAAEPERIASELLAPLARYGLVIVATRDRSIGADGDTLLDLLGPVGCLIDLGTDPEGTDADVARYVERRLEHCDVAPPQGTMDPAAAASAISDLVATSGGPRREGGFLLARVLTSQLREHPIDTTRDGWEDGLVHSVEDALRQDLERGAPLQRGELVLPSAGQDLLTALAFSYGSGIPADDVWPVVASAITATDDEYERSDAYWALAQYRRYVTASGLSGQAVYRLHQRLADVLRADHEQRRGAPASALAAEVAVAVLAVYEELLRKGRAAHEHRYLWLYAWLHAVDGGRPGIERLERLAEIDPALRADVGRAYGVLAMRRGEAGQDDAIDLSERAVAVYEELAHDAPAFLGELAGALSNLGVRLSDAGRDSDAVGPAQRSVEILESLVADDPSVSSDHASALSNLGVRYSRVGLDAEAVALTKRSVEIRERLAEADPAARGDLASALSNLGSLYSTVGRKHEALDVAERAVGIYDELDPGDPTLLGELASALNNLGIRYAEVGRWGEGVGPTERSVEIRESLSDGGPVARGDLASALSNLGIRYADVGQHRRGLEPTERAVAILDELAADRRAYLDPLASTLVNLGGLYNQLGRVQDGVAPTERAVAIYETLIDDRPGLRGDLASALNNLAGMYSDLRSHEQAVSSAERAVEIREQLETDDPPWSSGLAAVLNTLGAIYSTAGRPRDAVEPTERAVAIYGALAAGNPAYRGELASALSNLGVRYAELGNHTRAMAPSERAIAIYDELVEENPAFRRDLAGTLSNLGAHYGQAGQLDKALAVSERAVDVRERLDRETPADRGSLASALSNLGVRYAKLDRHTDAVPPTERAVSILDELVVAAPIFRDELARALGNLSSHYHQSDRDADAIVVAERAADLFRELAPVNPGGMEQLAAALDQLALINTAAGHPEVGQQRWAAALADVAHDRVATRALHLYRARRADERALAIDDVVQVHRLDDGSEPEVTLQARAVTRRLRSSDPAGFDRQWQDAIGPLPAWLQIGQDVVEVVVRWLDTPSWSASRTHLEEHTETLLAYGDLVLAEIELLGDRRVAHHQRLLAAVRETGIDGAFAPLLPQDDVTEWLRIDDREAAERYLHDHADALTTKEAAMMLGHLEQPERLALVILAGAGRTADGYAMLRNPERIPGELERACAEGRADVLLATAQLATLLARSADERALGGVFAVIAMILDGDEERAWERCAQVDLGGVDRNPLIRAVSDAISHHVSFAPALAEVIRRLTAS